MLVDCNDAVFHDLFGFFLGYVPILSSGLCADSRGNADFHDVTASQQGSDSDMDSVAGRLAKTQDFDGRRVCAYIPHGFQVPGMCGRSIRSIYGCMDSRQCTVHVPSLFMFEVWEGLAADSSCSGCGCLAGWFARHFVVSAGCLKCCSVGRTFHQDRQLRNSLEEMRLFSPDPDTAAHTRWRVWIYFSHMADVGGVMLLQDLFLKLVEVEISLSSQIWPVADRNAAFRSKIMLEALPALWLQISLLNLTLDTASSLSIAVTCFSIAFSFYNILKHLGLVFQALLPGLGMIEINSYRGSSCYNAQLASMFAFALCILIACIIRLFGTLLCPSSHSQHHHWVCPTLGLPWMCLFGYIFLRCATEEKKKKQGESS